LAAVRRKEQVHINNLPLEEEKVKRRKVRRKKKKQGKAKEKLKLIMGMGIAMSMALLLLYRYSEISKVRYDIVGLESKIEEATQNRNELNIELGEIKDSDWFVAEAKGRVNLRKAEEGQFVSVKVPSESQRPSSEQSGIKSVWTGLLGKFSK
jgi:cell division protein FtsL